MDGVFSRSGRLNYALESGPGSTLARLVDLISDGVVQSQVEAAEKLGVSKQRIHKLVKDYGLSLKRPAANRRRGLQYLRPTLSPERRLSRRRVGLLYVPASPRARHVPAVREEPAGKEG